MAWIVAMQRELHQGLAKALRAVQSGGDAAVLWLALLGFLYGVFHAAGPGHGKVVITTYLATQKETLGRGIALAVTASLIQGVVAIAVVFAAALVFAQTARQSQWLADRIELLSFALVAGLGLFLVWRHGRNLLRRTPEAACGGCGGHHHHHHAPPPRQAFMAGILSIGLRPCSGAVLVLVLAIALDLRLAGVAAVVAMSVGTALTVSGLAALAVLARDQAGRLADRLEMGGERVARAVDVVALLGGLLLAAMGIALLQAGLVTPVHPLMGR
jgi:ABC-type nickel/cobalt efflux system permease component RcnA